MLGLKLNHVSKRGHWLLYGPYVLFNVVMDSRHVIKLVSIASMKNNLHAATIL